MKDSVILELADKWERDIGRKRDLPCDAEHDVAIRAKDAATTRCIAEVRDLVRLLGEVQDGR